MTAESIIKINVDDGPFKRFIAVFEKYKESVKKLPEAWSKTNKTVNETGKIGQDAFDKISKKTKEATQALKQNDHVLKNIAHISGNIARNFGSISLSIAKWVALGATGGGFGLGLLSANSDSVRRQAQGLGVSTGDLRAANVNFGKYVDVDSALTRIADIQNDLSRRQILTRLGGKEGESPTEMFSELIRSSIKQFNQGGKTQQYAEALGLTQVFSLEELRRLSSLTEKELEQTIQQFNRDRQLLKVSDADNKALQDFWVQLKLAGQVLETSFIKALAPVSEQLIKLSSAIVDAIANFLASSQVKEALKEFTSWLSSNEAKTAIKEFIDGISTIAKVLVEVVKYIGKLGFGGNVERPDTPVGQTAPNGYTYKNGKIDPDNLNNYLGGNINFLNPSWQQALEKSRTFSGKITPKYPADIMSKLPISEEFNNPGNLRSWKGVPTVSSGTSSGSFAKFPSKEAGLQALAEQLRLYQNRDKLDTIEQIINKYSPSTENDTAAAIANISKVSGFAPNERLNLNNQDTLAKLIYGITKQENAQSNYTPSVVNQILVSNATGSDLVVTSNATR